MHVGRWVRMQTQRIEVGQHVLIVTTWSTGGVEITWWLRGRCVERWQG